MTDAVPPGARWYKFDFHTHTPASYDYGKGPDQATLGRRTPRDWLLDYMRAELDCVAVTDHNTGAWIDVLKNEYEKMKAAEGTDEAVRGFRKLTIFPGVEISASGGQKSVHVLAILPPTADQEAVARLLGGCKVPGAGSDAVSSQSPLEVCQKIDEFGFLAIPAHVECKGGILQEGDLFDVVGGEPLRSFIREAPVAAIEIVDPNYSKPQIYVEEKQNRRPWTEIVGSDAHHPIGPPGRNSPGSRFTWVKMGMEPTFEGLRLALDDGAASVRRSFARARGGGSTSLMMDSGAEDPNSWTHPVIESVSVSKSQYLGRRTPVDIRWSPWLNCIIGGRGTGKSTLLEMMRLVLRRDDELPRALRDSFARFRETYDRKTGEGVFRPDTEITLVLRVDSSRYRIQWRESSTTEKIEEQTESGSWKLVSGTIPGRFPVRIYSQKQIYELARDPAGLLRILDDSPEVGHADWRSRWDSESRSFLTLRAKAREIRAALEDEPRLMGELDAVRKKLAIFETSGHAEVLRAFQTFQRQEAGLTAAIQRARPMGESIRRLAASLESPALPVEISGARGEEELRNAESTARITVEAARLELGRIAGVLEEAVRTFETRVDQSEWHVAAREAAHAFEELHERLSAAGVDDPAQYGRLVQRRQMLEGELGRIEGLRSSLRDVEAQTEKLRLQLAERRRELTMRRTRFLEGILEGNEFVRISVHPYGDIESAEETFRAILGKSDTEAFAKDILEGEGEERVGLLADLYRDDPDQETFESRLEELKRILPSGRPPGGARDARFQKHLSGMRPEQFDRLLAWWPEDRLRIKFRSGNHPLDVDKGWSPIDKGSPGQKTAAMLAFILSHGTEPLILDQPEDDLDNHLIYNLIVSQIRERKNRRQMIVVTHNPNIVVNGDAELVVAMRTPTPLVGSLHDSEVRSEVCEVMEGGREALERRYIRVLQRSSGEVS